MAEELSESAFQAHRSKAIDLQQGIRSRARFALKTAGLTRRAAGKLDDGKLAGKKNSPRVNRVVAALDGDHAGRQLLLGSGDHAHA